ncbi:MAG: hypothetical protein RLY57_399 [Candidatus Parcubacteria bacterium]
MNNQTEITHGNKKNITLPHVISWIFGILFALVGIVKLFSDPLSAIFSLLASLVLIPPVIRKITGKFNLSRGVKIALAVLFIVLAVVSTRSDKQTTLVDTVNTPVDAVGVGNSTSSVNKAVESKVTQANLVTPSIVSTSSATVKPPVPSTVKSVQNKTISQKNAVRKAKSYLGYSAFSHDGLVEQLKFEQFSYADAVYGADNSGANWNEQAAKKSKSYMEYSSFSRGGLIEQLMYDKFTREQAEYGANAVGL